MDSLSWSKLDHHHPFSTLCKNNENTTHFFVITSCIFCDKSYDNEVEDIKKNIDINREQIIKMGYRCVILGTQNRIEHDKRLKLFRCTNIGKKHLWITNRNIDPHHVHRWVRNEENSYVCCEGDCEIELTRKKNKIIIK